MARITSGSAKNRKLKLPKIKNIRIAQDVVKQAVFAILADRVVNANCLDLFAGSGSFGIEALSRGALHCDFVDQHISSTETVLQNLKTCGFENNYEIYKDNAVKFAANTINKYDIIFADPFYDDTKHVFLLKNMEEILNEDGIICFFHGEALQIEKQIKDTNLEIDTQRKYGQTYLTTLIKTK